MRKEYILALAQFCRENLDFDEIELGSEYGYANMPLCIIDAVFSIGVRYTSVQNTVKRFCDFFGVTELSGGEAHDPADQLSVSAFLNMYAVYGVDGMTELVYRNRQRTSTHSGILKSEAVYRFAQVVAKYGVEYLQDIDKILGKKEFEAEITQIPGQRSGISLRYFYMLAGSEDFIKPDRMINRFVYAAVGKSFGMVDTTQLLVEACKELAKDYPGLTPRTLDNVIWQYQRVSGEKQCRAT